MWPKNNNGNAWQKPQNGGKSNVCQRSEPVEAGRTFFCESPSVTGLLLWDNDYWFKRFPNLLRAA
jgi:hypothetical protein